MATDWLLTFMAAMRKMVECNMNRMGKVGKMGNNGNLRKMKKIPIPQATQFWILMASKFKIQIMIIYFYAYYELYAWRPKHKELL